MNKKAEMSTVVKLIIWIGIFVAIAAIIVGLLKVLPEPFRPF